jgi:hypothetical protein
MCSNVFLSSGSIMDISSTIEGDCEILRFFVRGRGDEEYYLLGCDVM